MNLNVGINVSKYTKHDDGGRNTHAEAADYAQSRFDVMKNDARATLLHRVSTMIVSDIASVFQHFNENAPRPTGSPIYDNTIARM